MSFVAAVFLCCIIFSHSFVISLSDAAADLFISGPTHIDECGDIHLNIFWCSYLFGNIDFEWFYTFNNISKQAQVSGNNRQVFISNVDILNMTRNNMNDTNNVNIMIKLQSNHNPLIFKMITIHKSDILPYIEIDGGDTHHINIDTNHYNIIPNIYYSQCLSNDNNNNMSLLYEWKQISNQHIKIEDINSKILQIPMNQLNFNEEYYHFQLTVSYDNNNYNNVSHNVVIHTSYAIPIPLAHITQSIHISELIITISVFDLFNIKHNESLFIYQYKWLCYEQTNAKDCTNIMSISDEYEYEMNIDTSMLSVHDYYIFQLIITNHNTSVSSKRTYYIETNAMIEMQIVSVIPHIIAPLQTIKISICMHQMVAYSEWILNTNSVDYNTELLISDHIGYDLSYAFDYVHFVSFNAQCPIQTNLYLNVQNHSVSVAFSAQNAMISTDINVAQIPFDGECVILNDINDMYSSSSVALFVYKYPYLFDQIRVVCYDYIDISSDTLYYNFKRQRDDIYLFDDWMMTTSYIDMAVFIQQNHSIYGLIRNEYGSIASHLIQYISSKSVHRSQFHILSTDLLQMIDVDLTQSISISDYKLSFIIISAFLDAFTYGIHEYDFLNEPQTVRMIMDHLFINLQRLRRTFPSPSSSSYVSYLSLQMIHILHSFLTDHMMLIYMDTTHIHNVLQLFDIVQDMDCNERCLFKLFDIISSLFMIETGDDDTTLNIINSTLYLSYLYLMNDRSATSTTQIVHYISDDDRMSIQLLTAYTNSNNSNICRSIANITRIPASYPYETVFCIKWILEYDDILSNMDSIAPLTITHLISSDRDTFELLWNDERLCTFMTTSIEYYNDTFNISMDEYIYPECLYWDFNGNEWMHNTSTCWLSHYNGLSSRCSCYTFIPILKLKLKHATPMLDISEYFSVGELNINNIFRVYPIPIYIVSCLFLIMITFMALTPERNTIPLWIMECNITDMDKKRVLCDEMGAIYTIYNVYGFQRCCNLYALNVQNDWFLTEICCRSFGTNITSLERILLLYLYIINVIAFNTYLYSRHTYHYVDISNISLYYPFIVISVVVIIPVVVLKLILKHIQPVDFYPYDTGNKASDVCKESKDILNEVYSDEECSYHSDHTPKLNDLASTRTLLSIRSKRATATSMEMESVTETCTDICTDIAHTKPINHYRICVEQMMFDPHYKWILDPARPPQSPAKSVVIKHFIPNQVHGKNGDNFLWFTAICRDCMVFAQKESEITRSTFDRILPRLPHEYRDCVYSICNVDNEAFIVFEELCEFIDAILLGSAQQTYSDINDLEFDLRDMRHTFEDKVVINEVFEDRKYINTETALGIIAKLRGINDKYCIRDIAVPLLTGFTKKAMVHCMRYCSRIFWKILTNEWWDYDDDEVLKHENKQNVLRHLAQIRFDDLFPDETAADSSSESSLSNDTSDETLDSSSFSVVMGATPTIASMNAPQPMMIGQDIEKEMKAIECDNYFERMLLIKTYYEFEYKWRKYIHFVIILWILYASIMTLIYGVHLDILHYFENDLELRPCDAIHFIDYNRTQSVVIAQNNGITNSKSGDLTWPWLYCLLMQLLMYVVVYQPIVIAISSLIQHQIYKYKQYRMHMFNQINGDIIPDLMSFFIDRDRL